MEINKSTILDIEKSIIELNITKQEWTFKKKNAENELSILNNKVRSAGKLLKSSEYKKVCNQQDKLKKQIFDIEKEIAKLAQESSRKNHLKDQLKNEISVYENKDVSEKLVQMRDYYINFAADRSRVSSMRAVAAEVAEKLEVIIKTI